MDQNQSDQIASWWQMIGDCVGALPWSAHVMFLLTLGGGIVLLLVGSRFLRTAFALSGAILAAMVGYFVPAGLQLGFHPMITAGVLAVAGMVLGIIAFRFTVAICLAAALGVIAPLVAFGVTSVFEPVHLSSGPPGALSLQEQFLDGVPLVGDDAGSAPATAPGDDAGTSEIEEAAQVAAERVARFLRSVRREMGYLWERLPPRTRRVVFWAGVLGPLAGLAFGFASPKRAGTITTALVGSAMVLVSGWWLLLASGAPIGRLPGGQSVHTWAVILLWILLAGAGVSVQWTRKKALPDTD